MRPGGWRLWFRSGKVPVCSVWWVFVGPVQNHHLLSTAELLQDVTLLCVSCVDVIWGLQLSTLNSFVKTQNTQTIKTNNILLQSENTPRFNVLIDEVRRKTSPLVPPACSHIQRSNRRPQDIKHHSVECVNSGVQQGSSTSTFWSAEDESLTECIHSCIRVSLTARISPALFCSTAPSFSPSARCFITRSSSVCNVLIWPRGGWD